MIRVEAEVFDGNVGSMRMLEKCGFECEARMRRAVVKSGVVMDAFLYARVRGGAAAVGGPQADIR